MPSIHDNYPQYPDGINDGFGDTDPTNVDPQEVWNRLEEMQLKNLTHDELEKALALAHAASTGLYE